MKNLIIVSGVNGAGKTTFGIPYTQIKGYEFLNADEIAKKITDAGKPNAMIKAGRIFFQRLNNYLKKEKSFVVETTLSGSYINKVARKAQKKGYKITVIYIFIDNVETSIQRVRSRVLKGGHDVPLEDLLRRFSRSKANFWENFTEIADEWFLMYNGTEGFQRVARGEEREFSIENKVLFSLFHSKK